MSLLRKKEEDASLVWRQCAECGNRYPVPETNSGPNWCSTRCENAGLRRQRDQVETTWIRATWFLR
jgi:hypothetical protein